MTTHFVSTQQIEGMTLKSTLPDGEVMLDVPMSEGGNGNGIKPKPLMLTSLTGCTALDVVSLLKKMKIDPALATGPFITTSNDIIALFIYFAMATYFLHIV